MDIIKNTINIHECAKGHQLISRRVDTGITPKTITCRVCQNIPAYTKGYNVDQSLTPTHEWYKPAFPDRIRDIPTREHALRGGLLLREVGEGDYTKVLSARTPDIQSFSKSALRALTNKKARS